MKRWLLDTSALLTLRDDEAGLYTPTQNREMPFPLTAQVSQRDLIHVTDPVTCSKWQLLSLVIEKFPWRCRFKAIEDFEQPARSVFK